MHASLEGKGVAVVTYPVFLIQYIYLKQTAPAVYQQSFLRIDV